MIKIKANKVEDVTEYDVEPKVVTLYYAGKYNKNVIEYKNCIFKTASHIIANDYLLEYENNGNGLLFSVDITTGIVNNFNEYFLDYEQAVKIHRERRIKFLKSRINTIENRIIFLEEEDRKELEELENFEKKGDK